MSIRLPIRFLPFLLLLLLAACSESPHYQPLAPGAVVLAFGDSVTYGTGAGRGEDYPTRLARLSGWQVVNAGIPGDTALAARGRIAALLEEEMPALVIVELGGNDFLRRRAEAEVKEDLRAILQTVKAAGAQPVLVAVPGLSLLGATVGRLADAAIYHELAREEAVPLVEKVFAEVLSDPALRADRIHPNAVGYQLLADGIADSLARVGLLRR